MQTQTIFDAIYFLALTAYTLLSLFIAYHIIRYSMDRIVMLVSLVFFIAGTVLLIFSNAVSFFSIPFDQIAPSIPVPTSAPKFPF